MDINRSKAQFAADEKGVLAWIKGHKAITFGLAAAVLFVIILIATGGKL